MDQYIGKMLDNRYEILELIGSGGMANVYKAKCHRLNRMVAVKILKNDLAENADFRRRFRDESLAVAQLSHANIVSVYDVSRSGDTEYIVMELVDGITLKQYMERRGKMDWRWAPSTTSPRSRPEVTAPTPAAISTPPAWCSMRCLPAVCPSRGSPPCPWPSST